MTLSQCLTLDVGASFQRTLRMGRGKSGKTRTRARRFIGERGEHTITDRMTLQEEKGVLNWRIATVVLFIIFAEQLVCSMLYADSPFLIEEYFPGVD